jgi:hypothetical protein
MSALVRKACWQLIRFDGYLSRGDFAVFYDRVRKHRLHPEAKQSPSIEQICRAVDIACIWYWKKILCLQRSAATACLLKDHGVPAHLVIGAAQIPFRCHAWVEVNGVVVNDKPYTPEMYAVLDRC